LKESTSTSMASAAICGARVRRIPKRPTCSPHDSATEMIRRYQSGQLQCPSFPFDARPPHVLDVCDRLGVLVIDERHLRRLADAHARAPDWMEHSRHHALVPGPQPSRRDPVVRGKRGTERECGSPAVLAEFRGSLTLPTGADLSSSMAMGPPWAASCASIKRYVKTIEDLQNRGGRSSGCARDTTASTGPPPITRTCRSGAASSVPLRARPACERA
jgi:hypothetical protein